MRTLSLLLCLLPFLLSAAWHDRKAEGWAWYEDRLKEPEKQETSQEQIQNVRKELEEKLSLAILNPTHENVLAYMKEQKQWIDKTADFASIWTLLLLNNPHLDETITGRPTSQYGLQVYNAQQLEKRETLIRSLSQDHGLLFFYEGNNPISSTIAQIVQEFSKKYGWEVLPITTDGESLIPYSKNDNGISTTMGIDFFPALVVVDPKTNTATPIAYGIFTIDKLEENLAIQFHGGTP